MYRSIVVERSRFQDRYVRRVVDIELDELFPQLPAIVLDGPKGVGKTETALQRATTTWRLDDPIQREALDADPSLLAFGDRPVLVDEWQRLPQTWDAVRRAVDDDPSGGRFLLTGSAPVRETHSGAGRITTFRMRPLTLSERGATDPTVSFRDLLDGRSASTLRATSPITLSNYVDEIVAGGWPGLRHLEGAALDRQLDSYLDRIVERDMQEAGHRVRRPVALRNWMRAYAAATATTASWETIRDAATSGYADKPARSTVQPYVDALTWLRILDPVDAWLPTNNAFARLSAGPKHHLVDPALAARLLGQTRAKLLMGGDRPIALPRAGSLVGSLFESLAVLCVRTFAQAAGGRVFHLRTNDGRHEIDIIVERDSGVLALEVKLAATVDDDDVKHLVWLRDKLGIDLIDAVVLTTGPLAYRRRDGIAVVPLALLGP